MENNQQLYKNKPTKLKNVHGSSSRTIFLVMMDLPRKDVTDHPWDVDDWERNRALLICYPEWKSRLKEMADISEYWEVLVNNWETIEDKYNQDYEKYGNMAYGMGECDNLIKSLINL
jgi:hypothetical protein